MSYDLWPNCVRWIILGPWYPQKLLLPTYKIVKKNENYQFFFKKNRCLLFLAWFLTFEIRYALYMQKDIHEDKNIRMSNPLAINIWDNSSHFVSLRLTSCHLVSLRITSYLLIPPRLELFKFFILWKVDDIRETHRSNVKYLKNSL